MAEAMSLHDRDDNGVAAEQAMLLTHRGCMQDVGQFDGEDLHTEIRHFLHAFPKIGHNDCNSAGCCFKRYAMPVMDQPNFAAASNVINR
jgi:hypothetical protein